jgi:chemotaxis protein MotB
VISQRADTAASDTDLTATLVAFEWEAKENEEIWLVSYADIISTLLAMVVLLFGRLAITNAAAVEALDEVAEVTEPIARSAEPPQTVASVPPLTALPSPDDQLAALVEARFAGRITAERRAAGLKLTIPEVALFDSAHAELQTSASPLLDELTATLREVGDAQISVEGHTDSQPIAPGGVFDSNWDLAAARAIAVTRYLVDRGFMPGRLHSVSYADTRPVADNATADGRAANRRVELQIEFAAPG